MREVTTIGSWKIHCSDSYLEHHTQIRMIIYLIEKSGDFFYLQDDIDKINDISKMPIYITEDWINYNKKDIEIPILDKLIKSYERSLNNRHTIPLVEEEKCENDIKLLKSLKRDIKIKKII